MSFARLGILISLFLSFVLAIQCTVRGDIVLPTLEAYADNDLSRPKKMMMASHSKEVQSKSSSAKQAEALPVSKQRQVAPARVADGIPVINELDSGIEDISRLVPEPSGIHLVVMSLVFLATRRRRAA